MSRGTWGTWTVVNWGHAVGRAVGGGLEDSHLETILLSSLRSSYTPISLP